MVWRQASDLREIREGDDLRFGTTVSTPVELEVHKKGIDIRAGPLSRHWESTDISYVLTQEIPSARPKQWSLHIDSRNDGLIEILRSFNELHILKMAEAIAVSCDAKLAEHTGRRVREDEHGMSVITQLTEVGERWDEPVELDSLRFSFKKDTNGYSVKLPTEMEDGALANVLWSSLAALVLGFMITLATIQTANLWVAASWSLGLLLLNLIAWARLEGPTGSLENRHRLTLTKHTITIGAKLYGIIPKTVGQWRVTDLLDLDCNDKGEATFLLKERRVKLRLLRPEAIYLVASFGRAMRDLGLAPEASSEEE
ncbi:MAG TPA: hypothetical protein EYQ85_06140 [Candidatus Poseidoniales archaeon]|jgi:hypothetical protein|nr:MAG: hypothetical protein CXT68_08415 [Euryarchaeota archaeon]HIF16813.1 hypothetical protein [Candidatus Poseidoniales archaeon]